MTKILNIPIFSIIKYEDYENCIEIVNPFSSDILDSYKYKICQLSDLYNENNKIDTNEILKLCNDIESELTSLIQSYESSLNDKQQQIENEKKEKDNLIIHLASEYYIYIYIQNRIILSSEDDDTRKTRLKEKCKMLDGLLSYLYTDKGSQSQTKYNKLCDKINEDENIIKNIHNIIILYSILVNIINSINDNSIKPMTDVVYYYSM